LCYTVDLPQCRLRGELEGFVIDLRNNSGGLVDQAIAVSSAFLDQGEIASMPSRNAEDTQRFNARRGDLAVQCWHGVGLGDRRRRVAGPQAGDARGHAHFRQGSVQTIIPLGPPKGALRSTTAWPSGRSIQAKGIEPDMPVLQDVPADLAPTDAEGEASMRGHLKVENLEKSGS
jgi:carboxyl-terminal processing protease